MTAAPFFSRENALNWLLVFFPVALLLEHVFHASAVTLFAVSSLALLPLAAQMGHATEELSERVGEGVGGLLNATFGNAAEMIIAIMALRAGLYELVKASITGSIIGNILLVFGLAALMGGFKFPAQRFNRTAASLGSTMLLLSAIALVFPAVFHWVVGANATAAEQELSLEISIVLMLAYVASLVFALKTHKHLYTGSAQAAEHTAAPSTDAPPLRPVWKPLGVLLLATAGVALMAEILVVAAEASAQTLGWNEVFVGVIVVAIVGNCAEHSSAILMAMKNKMDISVNIAVGSSIQVALFVAPALVFLSYFIGPRPMDLLFTPLEVVAVGASVFVMSQIAHDGESNWMEGVMLLAVYAIIALAFFFLPLPGA